MCKTWLLFKRLLHFFSKILINLFFNFKNEKAIKPPHCESHIYGDVECDFDEFIKMLEENIRDDESYLKSCYEKFSVSV